MATFARPDSGMVTLLSLDDMLPYFSHLRALLSGLPAALPQGHAHYNFVNLEPSSEDIDNFGEEGALNHSLEIIFCPGGRQAGPIVFKERGPGLTAVVEHLTTATTKFPTSVILQKWVFDLIDAAKAHGASIHSESDPENHWDLSPDLCLDESSDSESESNSRPPKKRKGAAVTQKAKAHATMVENVMEQYIDILGRPKAKGAGGRKRDELLDRLTVLTSRKKNPTKLIYRCLAATSGCDRTFPHNRNRLRVLGHAEQCTHLPHSLRQAATGALTQHAPSALLASLSSESPSPDSESLAAKPNTESLPEAVSNPEHQPQPAPTLDAALKKGRKARIEEAQIRINSAVLRFICVAGIPPSVVNLPEWGDLWKVANKEYQPVSRYELEEKQILGEAGWIKEKMVEEFRRQENLTLTFDGGTTRGLQSIYTVHVTKPDRHSFLWVGDQATDQSHTAEHLRDVLLPIIKQLGPLLVRALGSDNTGNTSGARVLVKEIIPWIIILPDCCHHINLLVKDICHIEYFVLVLKNVRGTIQHFKKSSYASAQLRKIRKIMEIKRGLVSIGKTRFGTAYHSGESVRRNRPAIEKLCREGVTKIKNVNHLYLPGFAASDFALKLDQFLAVLAPLAKSITCLESSHSTVSDVFVFWLAIMAEFHAFLTDKDNPLEVRIKEDIRQLANFRYRQMFDDNDVYLTGFILDPRYRGMSILHKYNPLSIGKITLNVDRKGKTTPTGINREIKSLPEPAQKAARYLLNMLKIEYQVRKTPIAGLSDAGALFALKEQFPKYIMGLYPFNLPMKPLEKPADWWARVGKNHEAEPLAKLAIILFALVPNSMADERTASTFTWLNDHLRARQKSDTLVRMTQIRQYHKHEASKRKPTRVLPPTVKFRDLQKTLEEAKAAVTSKKRRRKNDGEKSEDDAAEESDVIETDDDDDEFEEDQIGMPAECLSESRWRLAGEDVADLTSADLRDLLSDSPVERIVEAPQQMEESVALREDRPLMDSDWTID